MQKIVINVSRGGFDLSDTAQLKYLELAGHNIPEYHWEIARDNPHLVQVVEQLGTAASTRYSKLKVVEIPDGVEWTLEGYGGSEWIAEKHRTWG